MEVVHMHDYIYSVYNEEIGGTDCKYQRSKYFQSKMSESLMSNK